MSELSVSMPQRGWRRVTSCFGALIGVGTSAALVVLATVGPVAAGADPRPGGPSPTRVLASTVPSNGDVNPYGVAVVPRTVGDLVARNVLVSNFNDATNLQGTGTTLVEVAPSGSTRVFATISSTAVPSLGRVGLTTALTVLRSGWVIVGDLPTSTGTAGTSSAGGLIVLNPQGKVVGTITGPDINGPWDMTALTAGGSAVLFVSNVLNGTVTANGTVVDGGTVVRITVTSPTPGAGVPQVTSEQVVATGFPEASSASALVVGPTGLGLSPVGSLYVADTIANSVQVIPDALTRTTSDGTGTMVSHGGALTGPLGLTVSTKGSVLTVNGGNGNLVDLMPTGSQRTFTLDTSGTPPGSGALFGLALAPGNARLYFVDDATNTLDMARLVGR